MDPYDKEKTREIWKRVLGEEESCDCRAFDSELLRRGQKKSEPRTVSFFELELFHDKGGISHIDNAHYPCRRGMLLCAKPGQKRHSVFPLRCSFIRIAAGKDLHLDAILQAAPTCIYIEDEGTVLELMGLFSRLASLCIGSDAHAWDTARANAMLLEAVWRCMRLWQRDEPHAAGTTVSHLTREAYEYIYEHYTEACSLKEIAETLHVSPNYLHTVFKHETGKTPLAHVQYLRIEKAKKLILAGELSMLEIAMETGFSSQSHFNKVFKALTAQTPAQWRQGLVKGY